MMAFQPPSLVYLPGLQILSLSSCVQGKADRWGQRSLLIRSQVICLLIFLFQLKWSFAVKRILVTVQLMTTSSKTTCFFTGQMEGKRMALLDCKQLQTSTGWSRFEGGSFPSWPVPFLFFLSFYGLCMAFLPLKKAHLAISILWTLF